jgi:hypothetical protein
LLIVPAVILSVVSWVALPCGVLFRFLGKVPRP